MTYTTIKPPFRLKFWEMPKEELKEYNKWFHAATPERIQELTDAITESPEFNDWKADLSARSLETLGEWLSTQVETRPRTTDEIAGIASQSPYPIKIEDWELTDKTISLAMDVGMYLSQVLLRNHGSLKWEQPLKNKKFIDYGQPVLTGFGAMPFNPVQMMITLAYGLIRKKHAGRRLRELYDIWNGMIK